VSAARVAAATGRIVIPVRLDGLGLARTYK